MRYLAPVLTVALALVALGCGATKDAADAGPSDSGAPECNQGVIQDCDCTTGIGRQTCDEHGQWGPCDCHSTRPYPDAGSPDGGADGGNTSCLDACDTTEANCEGGCSSSCNASVCNSNNCLGSCSTTCSSQLADCVTNCQAQCQRDDHACRSGC